MAEVTEYNNIEEAVSVDNGEAKTVEMKKEKNVKKDVAIFLLSFCVPALIFAGFWAVKGIYWNGPVTPLIYDMNAQYMPFMTSLRYVLSGETSIFYNWNLCLGGNYLSLFAYYLASPLNWITVFFSIEDMPNAIYLLTLLKIALCGLTFSMYLKWGVSKGESRWINFVFASCYALMSYNVMFSVCIMWMEGVILLPIILIGVEQLLDGKKGLLYYIAIAGLFFANFYISYMVGIFTAVYILARTVCSVKKETVKYYFWILVKFFVCTVLALGTSAVLLYPALKAYFSGVMNALEGEEADVLAYNFGIVDLLKKLLPQQYDSLENGGLPLIYCGSIVAIMAILFLLVKNRTKEKIEIAIMLTLPTMGFLSKTVDYALHGFQYPHSYTYRYAFVFSFTVILAAYKFASSLDYSQKLTPMLMLVFGVYTLFELFLNGSVLTDGMHAETGYIVRNQYDKKYSMEGALLDVVNQDEGFARVSGDQNILGYNTPIMYNVKGMQSFTSTFNYSLTYFLKQIGADVAYRVSSGQGLSPLMEALLSVKYKVSEKQNDIYKQVKTVVDDESGMMLTLYENPYALPPAIFVGNGMLFDLLQPGDNTFTNQNTLLRYYGIQDNDLFCELDSKELEDGGFSFTANSNGPVYLYFESYEIEQEDAQNGLLHVYLNDDYLISISTGYLVRTVELHGIVRDTPNTVRLKSAGNSHAKMKVYSFDRDKLEAIMQDLRKRSAETIECDESYLRASIQASEDGIVVICIPYIDGIHIKIDGREAAAKRFLGSLISTEVEPGNHTIELQYSIPGIKLGMFISCFSVILNFLYLFCVRNVKKYL